MSFAQGGQSSKRLLRVRKLFPVVVLLCTVPFAIRAVGGKLEIGGDRGQRAGIDVLAALLNRLPAGTPIYNYGLDWHLGYYLGVDSAVHSVFQPSPQALRRAVCMGNKSGYFATLAHEAESWFVPLRASGVGVSLLWQSASLELYRLDCDF